MKNYNLLHALLVLIHMIYTYKYQLTRNCQFQYDKINEKFKISWGVAQFCIYSMVNIFRNVCTFEYVEFSFFFISNTINTVISNNTVNKRSSRNPTRKRETLSHLVGVIYSCHLKFKSISSDFNKFAHEEVKIEKSHIE